MTVDLGHKSGAYLAYLGTEENLVRKCREIHMNPKPAKGSALYLPTGRLLRAAEMRVRAHRKIIPGVYVTAKGNRNLLVDN